MQVIEKVKSFGRKAADKAVMAAVSAAVAANALAVNAFAEPASGSSGFDMSQITSVLESSFVSLVSNIMSVVVAVIPIGLGLFGAAFTVRKVKQVFTKVT